jgi:hypothetical protein
MTGLSLGAAQSSTGGKTTCEEQAGRRTQAASRTVIKRMEREVMAIPSGRCPFPFSDASQKRAFLDGRFCEASLNGNQRGHFFFWIAYSLVGFSVIT